MFKFFIVFVVFILFGLSVSLTQSSEDFELPFEGSAIISVGPGCSETHGRGSGYYSSSQAMDFILEIGRAHV